MEGAQFVEEFAGVEGGLLGRRHDYCVVRFIILLDPGRLSTSCLMPWISLL